MSGNTSSGSGGGLVANNGGGVTLSGSSVVSNTAGETGGGISASSDGFVTVADSSVLSNTAYVGGGGLFATLSAITVTGGAVAGNSVTAADLDGGGGILADGGGTITVSATNVLSNTARYYGGGVYVSHGSAVTLNGSTVAGNTNVDPYTGGGGIALQQSSAVTLTNSTVSGNSASPGDNPPSNASTQGGGIDLPDDNGSSRVTLVASTIAGNSAASGDGVYDAPNNAATNPVALRQTILATNSASSGPDCSGPLTSGGYNLVGTASGCGFSNAGGDQQGIDPRLGPLAGNGGPTPTQALLPGSPAIDAAPFASCSDTSGARLATDQRGVTRPQPVGGACDIGAYELAQTATPYSGTVSVWGGNSKGQLGDGDTSLSPGPVATSGLTGVVGLAATSDSSLAVTADGTAYAWGNNSNGELGIGTTDTNAHPTPVQVSVISNVVALAGGGDSLGNSVLALLSDGSVWAWGSDQRGQLGDGAADSTPHATPARVPSLSGVTGVATSGLHSLAVKNDGTVWAWGDNSSGELGLGTSDINAHPTPVQVPISDVVVVNTTGQDGASFAIKRDGTLWAWGANNYGQLGIGSNTEADTPTQVPGLSDIMAVQTAGGHSIALKRDGTVYTFGESASGQGGNGSLNGTNTPAQVTGLTDVAAISAAIFHNAVVKRDGTVWTWGIDDAGGNPNSAGYNGAAGQLGYPATQTNSYQAGRACQFGAYCQTRPKQVPGVDGAVAVVAGHGHTLALGAPLQPAATETPTPTVATETPTPMATPGTLFTAPVTYPVQGGEGSSSVAIADLNGDSHPDLAAGGLYESDINVLLGDSSGAFPSNNAYPASYSQSVAVADITGDGYPDLVYTDDSSAGVGVLPGDGSGVYTTTATEYSADDGPVALAVGDLNGDGKPDVAVACANARTVAVLFNDGAGGLSQPVTYTIGGPPTSIAIADLNGDGRPDLIVGNAGTQGYDSSSINGSGVSVLFNTGDGAFGSARRIYGDYYPTAVAAADLNGDGYPDLVVTSRDYDGYSSGDGVHVLLNDGAGHFGAATRYDAGVSPASVAIADLDGDGHPDLAVANQTDPGAVSVLLGDGAGGFTAGGAYAAGSNPVYVAAGDLNNDGNPDLAVAGASVSVLLNTSPSRAGTPTATIGTATATDTATVANSATASTTPTSTDTETSTPTATATATDSATASTTPSATPPTLPSPVGTATPSATNTPTSTVTPSATETPTDTPTETSTPSATSTDIPTRTPMATSTVAPSATPIDTPPGGYCFDRTVGGWRFVAAGCPQNGTVTNVQVTAPGGLQLAARLPLLSSLPVDASDNLRRPVHLPDLSLVLAGFPVTAAGTTVDTDGLTVMTTTLTLPNAFGGSGVEAHDLRIGTDGSISGTATFAAQDASFAIGAFALDASGITLTRDGLGASTLTLMLPRDLVPSGVDNTLVGHNVQLNADGTFGGSVSLPDTSALLDGFPVALRQVSFDGNQLAIGGASYTLPPSIASSPPITLTGANLSIDAGGALRGSLGAGPATVALDGFVVRTGAIMLNGDGLRLAGVTLTLPDSFSAAIGATSPVTLSAGDAAIDPAGNVIGTLSLSPIHAAFQGLTLDATGVTLGNHLLRLDTFTLTLPASFTDANGAPVRLTAHGVSIDKSGNVVGALVLSPVHVDFHGFALDTGAISLGNHLLSTDALTLTLPITLFGATAAGTPYHLVASGVSFDATGHLSGAVDLAPTPDDTPSGPPDASDAPSVTALARSSLASVSWDVQRPDGMSWERWLLAGIRPRSSVTGVAGAAATGRVARRPTFARGVQEAALSRALAAWSMLGPGAARYSTIAGVDAPTTSRRTDSRLGSRFTTLDAARAVADVAARTGPLAIRPALFDDAPLHAGFEGFVLDASGFTLNDAGLGIAAMTVTLPLSNIDGSGPAQLTGTGIGIASSGAVSGTLGLPHYAGSLFGFPVAADNLRLGDHALRLDAITVTLPLSNTDGTAPAQLVARGGGGSNPAPVSIDPHGNVIGTLSLPHFAGSFFGFGLAADNVRLGNHALRVDAITVTLPISNGDETAPLQLTASGDNATGVGIDAKGNVTGNLGLDHVAGKLLGFDATLDRLSLGDHALRVGAITVTLPLSNTDGTGPALLVATGSRTDPTKPISIDPKGHVDGDLTLSSLKGSLFGFPTEVSNLTLGDHAVSIGALTVTLPLSTTGSTPMPYLLTSIGVGIRSDGSISGTIGLSELHGSFLGFKLDTGKVTLGNHALTLASFALTLPDAFGQDANGANRRITASAPVSIDNHGHVVGTVQLPNLDATFQGFDFHGRGITLGSGGIGIADASVPVPYLTGSDGAPTTLHGSLTMASPTGIAASLGVANADVTYGSLGGLRLVNAQLSTGGIAVDLTYPLPAFFGGNGATRLEGLLNVTAAGGSYSANAILSLQGQNGGRPSLTVGGFAASAGAVSLTISSSRGVALTAAGVQVPLTGLSNATTLTGDLTATFANGSFNLAATLSAINVPITFGAFPVLVGSLRLGSAGIDLSDASVALPDIAQTPLVLRGSLKVSRDPASGHISFDSASLGLDYATVSLFTLPATLRNLRLGLGGPDGRTATLTVGSAAVDLSGLGTLVSNLSVTSLAVSNLSIVVDTAQQGYHVKFSGGAISTGLSFDAVGGHVDLQGLTLRNDAEGEGIGAHTINVTLPSALGGTQVSLNDFLLFTSADGHGGRRVGVYGAGRTPSFGFDLGIAKVTATGGVQLGSNANGFYLDLPRLDLTLPDPLGGGVSLTDLSYDRQGFHFGGVGGIIHAALPSMNFAAFRIDHVTADLQVATVAGRSAPVFVFAGQGDLILPGVNDASGDAGVHVAVQVGSVISPYTTVFRGLTINIELPAGLALPIGTTPFGINGGGGGVNVLNENGHATYAFHLDVHIISLADGGNLLSGDVRAAITTDGNLGLSASATVLTFIGVGGGFCFRNTVPPLQPDGKTRDGVCQSIGPMGPQIEKSTATGIFAEVYEGLYVDRPDGCRRDQDECISLVGSAYAHFWSDADGAEIAAVLGIRFKLPEGSIWHLIPPFDVTAGAQAQLGKFTYQSSPQRVFGVKGDVYAQGPCIPFTSICASFDKSVFVQLSGGVDIHLTGADDYTLYDTAGAPPASGPIQPNDVSGGAPFPTFTPTPRPGPVYRPPVAEPTGTPTHSTVPVYRPPVTETAPTATPRPTAAGTPRPTATPRTFHCINNKCDNGNGIPAAVGPDQAASAGASCPRWGRPRRPPGPPR